MPDSTSNEPLPAGDGTLPVVSPDVVEQDFPEEIDNIVPTRGYQMLPMVGLGGSAGSIPALRTFFEAMREDSGMAFAVILHLSAEHESMMAEVLGRSTRMPVVQAVNGQRVAPNTVYVIPPGKHLILTDGCLRLTPLSSGQGRRVAVDLFFRSLADTHGPHAAAVVLSGADGDGALGIKRIKERGGLTIAQDPDEAEHASMPRAAIDTGMVDWVLRVADMPARLLQYRDTEARLKLPPEEGPQPAKPPPEGTESNEKALRDVLAYLHTRTGRDFSYYKRATILRRISRRMQVNAVADLPGYLAFLRMHPGEAGGLLQDLLISVTNFFRDRDAFAALEAIVPALFEGKTTGNSVRVWTVACASGEEAYSVAMMLLEHASRMQTPPVIQIFATDLDADAIQIARDGFYPDAITADVSEERLRRFFTKEHGGYRLRREVRECVLFAVHDALRDAPFSRLDLVTCRNLLIYLTPEAQERVMETFHFALRPHGRLFLGASESVDEGSPLFRIVDKKYRIYEQIAGPRASVPLPIGPSTLQQAFEAQERAKGGPYVHGAAFSNVTLAPPRSDGREIESRRVSWEELHFKLIERFAPPSLIVTRDYEIVHISENAGRLLRFRGGEPSKNLLHVVHPMLRIELRAALFRAAQSRTTAEAFNVPVDLDGKPHLVDIRVSPAQEIAPDYLLVSLNVREVDPAAAMPRRVEEEPAIRHLERELEHMRARLRDTVEQYEASTEELKASNEELQAMNEELRSATEELETSREELQSINEELSTVNAELKKKVEEVSRSNSDLANLMAATGISTIFVDRGLRIMRYTPSAVELFHFIPSDVGRPLTDLTHRLNYPELRSDAEQVMATLIPTKREVSDGEGRWFLAQLLPYRTTDDHIVGAVLTFVEITESRAKAIALRESEEQLRLIVENAREYAIFSMDEERRITSWNSGAQTILGYEENEILGQPADVIFTEEDRVKGAPASEARLALLEGRAPDERWHVRKSGELFWGSGVMTAMRDASGKPIGLLKIFRDQTAELRAKEALEQSRSQLWASLQETERARAEAETAGRAKDRFLAVLSHELRTPLTPVMMAIHSLLRRADLPSEATEALEMIRRNVQMEARFIDDLLDITRLSHGKLELMCEPMDLHDAIQRAVEISMPDIQAKHQRLSVSLKATEHRLTGDQTRLQQVFWNLLKNASKFTPENGTIQVHSHDGQGRIVVDVSDSGIGFEPADTDRIMEAFIQANASITRQYGGLGLGLAISKATVDAHGGALRAESAGPGHGATFTVELPISR